MSQPTKDLSRDIAHILAKRHDNGGDFWATNDGRPGVGSPFSTLESLLLLHEYGLGVEHEAVAGAVNLLLAGWQDDGRFHLPPGGTIYPCQTANIARCLCRFGLAQEPRLERTVEHLLQTVHNDGGWRCNRVALGRSPQTDASNPGVTLFVLDLLRFRPAWLELSVVDQSVETLLSHWRTRRPLGPCEFGIGTLFMHTELPFLRYNLFSYVFVLSFFRQAHDDPSFGEALGELRSRLDEDGLLIVERPNRRYAGLEALARGRGSPLATRHYREIERNLARAGKPRHK
jgi:hypothetical protein